MKLRYSIFLCLAGLLIAVTLWLKQSPSHDAILSADIYQDFRTGDLIFRQGKSAVSSAVLSNRQNSTYSHVGMIVIVDGKHMVLHAAPPEVEGEFDGVKLETLRLFTQSDRAQHVAVMRPFKDEKAGQQAAKNAMQYLGKSFDAAFDLESDNRIYCTELIVKAYQPLRINLYTKLRSARLPLFEGEFLMPQDMFEKKILERIVVL